MSDLRITPRQGENLTAIHGIGVSNNSRRKRKPELGRNQCWRSGVKVGLEARVGNTDTRIQLPKQPDNSVLFFLLD